MWLIGHLSHDHTSPSQVPPCIQSTILARFSQQRAAARPCPLRSCIIPPLKCIVDQIQFSRRWDAVSYSKKQLDTVIYVRIQLDTVEHSGIQWICCKMARQIDTGIQRDTKDTVRYRRDTGEIQAGYPKNTRQGRLSAIDARFSQQRAAVRPCPLRSCTRI